MTTAVINKKIKSLKTESWVDKFAGKWQDSRSAKEIIADIRDARCPIFLQRGKIAEKK